MRFQHGVEDNPTRSRSRRPIAWHRLQHGENLAVDGIETAVGLPELHSEIGHEKVFVPFIRFNEVSNREKSSITRSIRYSSVGRDGGLVLA